MSGVGGQRLARGRGSFFTAMAGVLLVIVFAGFARTFYLKPFFDTPPLPWYLVLHGVALSGWFVLFVVQSALVAANRPATHRRLGRAAVAAAAVLVPTTLYIILDADAATTARGVTRVQPIEVLVLGDLGALVPFVILTAVGISYRHRAAVHKRAMLLANIALVVPALPRLARLPVLVDAGPAVVPTVLLSLLLAVWVHDLRVHKRLHGTTLWGSMLVFGAVLGSFLLARTDVGRSVADAISF